jgi:hypothetical protein
MLGTRARFENTPELVGSERLGPPKTIMATPPTVRRPPPIHRTLEI